MKNRIKLVLIFSIFVTSLFVAAEASTSGEIYSNIYTRMYSAQYPSLSPSYVKDGGEGYVDKTHGSLGVNVEDYCIKGKNGFNIPFVRSYFSHSSGGDVFYKEYSSKVEIKDQYYTRFTCSADGKNLFIYFDNEKELFEAGMSFEGAMYAPNKDNDYSTLIDGTSVTTYVRDQEYGIYESTKEKTLKPCHSSAVDNRAFVTFKNTMKIAKPSIYCYDYTYWDDGEREICVIFQDINGQASVLDLYYDASDDTERFTSSSRNSSSSYCEYTFSAVDKSDISVSETHPKGFEYNMMATSDNGDMYYIYRVDDITYEVKAVSDRYGNTYLFDNGTVDNYYSVTTPEGDVYVCDTTGITKNSNGVITELVSYNNEVINDERDVNDEFRIDNTFIFTITKNSGTQPTISEYEENVTRYYFKRELLYEKLVNASTALPAYSLVYKIELPSGITKYSEYELLDEWFLGLPEDQISGNYYCVIKFYETDGTNTKNKSTYTYEAEISSELGDMYYLPSSIESVFDGNHVKKTINETYDHLSRVLTSEENTNIGDITYRYTYAGDKPNSKVKGLSTSMTENSESATHTKTYSYFGNQLSNETDGDYVWQSTFYDDFYDIPHEITYTKDDKITVKTENILSEDGKSIAQTKVYETREARDDLVLKTINYTYDRYGNIATETAVIDDNNSMVTSYDYDYSPGGGYTLTTTQSGMKDADGQPLSNIVTTTVFDFNHNPVSITDANGNTTTTTYDMLGRPLVITYPDGTTESYSYDMQNNITTFTAKNGVVYKAYFDAWGNRLKTTITDTSGEVILDEYEYDKRNNLISYKKNFDDNKYARATYAYDALDRIEKEAVYSNDTLLRETNYTYALAADSDGRPLTTVTAEVSADAEYAKQSITTDYRGNPIQKKFFTDTEEKEYLYTFDYVGNVLTETDPAGNTTTYTYDALNNPLMVKYADDSTERFIYNGLGLVSRETDAMGNRTEYVYDNAGRVIKTYTPFDNTDKGLTKTYYDANGNVTVTKVKTSEPGKTELFAVTENAYDSMNRLQYTTAYPADETPVYTKYSYDIMGNVIESTSGMTSLSDTASGQTYSREYDNLGRLTKLTAPDGKTETYTYDRQGRVLSATDKAGRTQNTTYDIFNNITEISKGEEEISFAYNENGLRTSMTDSTGTTSYTYDPFGQLTTETKGDILKEYTYDVVGNRTAFEVLDNGVNIINNTYTYDALGRMLTATDGTDVVSYTYDKNSNQTSAALEGKVYTKTEYNKANLPVKSSWIKSPTETDVTSYFYATDGNLSMKTSLDSNTMYYYDGVGRLVYENTWGNTANYTDTYAYDNHGNRTTRIHIEDDETEITDYTYNNLNQLLSSSDGFSYAYDNAGNMTSVSQDEEVVKSYSYDIFNRLSESTVNGTTANYTYNGDNLRQTKTANNVTTNHIYDGMNIVADISNNTKVYFRGTELVTQKALGSSSSQQYILTPRGDVSKLVNADGTHTDYEYNAFGEMLTTTEETNPFAYCGEYQDLCSGLIYLRNRYYDPSIGRFISEDPARDGLNWYVYCGNNPIMFVDPSGNIREPGYVNGVWCENPDAYEFGKKSDTYKILVDLGNRWNSGTSKQKDEYSALAENVRRLAREGTPIQYAQDRIINQLHKNAKAATDYQATMTTGFSGFMYQLGGGNYLADSSSFLIGMAYGDWNYKYDSNWQVPYDYFDGNDMNVDNNKNWRPWMYFDGMLVSADKFGNINMAYVGVKMNLPYSVFQNFATTDKDDAFWVQYGINMAEQGR